MEITEIQVDGYEKVARCRDDETGLHALIAVHNTTLGPALGGMRMLPYVSEDEALFDVLVEATILGGEIVYERS